MNRFFVSTHYICIYFIIIVNFGDTSKGDIDINSIKAIPAIRRKDHN